MSTGVVACDKNRRVLVWNAAMESITGCPRLTVLGRLLLDRFPALQDTREAKLVELTLSGEESVRRGLCYPVRGTPRFFDVHLYPLLRSSGEVSGALALIHDVTRQRELQQLVDEGQERVEATLGAGRIGIWYWDLLGNHVIWDEQVLSILGARDTGLAPEIDALLERVHPDDRVSVRESIASAVAARSDYDTTFRVVWPDGTVRFVAGRGKVSLGRRGKPEQLLNVCVDITVYKQADELARRNSLLQQREDFMATLAHDLKSPLVGANRLLELMTQGYTGELTEEQRRLLVRLRNGNVALLGMIENLLDVHRYELGSLALLFEELDFSQLVVELAQDYLPLAEGKGVEIKVRIADATACSVDQAAMRRVLQNVLDNALKFSEPGGSITLELECRDGNAVLSVADTGPGLTPEEQEQVFERFWQAPGGRRAGGTGLGLYLCKQIVQAHGGFVKCASRPGRGTTFIINLPMTKGRRENLANVVADTNPGR
jgi:PAS domain S-box-containing protein